MGISRDSRHKRRHTGGRRKIHQKKRKYELGRQPANTRIGQKRIHLVRCRGGTFKRRAIRLDHGNFSWGSENSSASCRIVDVLYNASNDDLVRTKTLVKNCIVQIDGNPFKQYYLKQYGEVLGKPNEDEEKVTKRVQQKREKRKAQAPELQDNLRNQFRTGRLYACITSRPGQCGRADGYVLEGAELDFYANKMKKKKK